MGSVKTVDLRAMGCCISAIGAVSTVATALTTAVTAITTAFARLVAALFSANAIARFAASVLRTTLAGLTAFTTLTARVLLRPVLARRAGLAIHGCGHGCLIGQRQVLLDRIARNALAPLGAFATFSALRALCTLAAAVATTFTVGAVWARLGVG